MCGSSSIVERDARETMIVLDSTGKTRVINIQIVANKFARQCQEEWNKFLEEHSLDCNELFTAHKNLDLPNADELREKIRKRLIWHNKIRL